ncbi:MAG TPA: hypothetical protein PK314_07840 [Deltaproteobacteria bacterium]|jgi:hypothetical protein|nr:hypothetical protein [Deltaproteobacteria bacterium]HOS26276.1 hypothetical protein [Deltaproteobacteria bacterium]HPW70151.1 hypothetical protein [Deltaproteobacteria bacterium]HRR22686.1 hypothetical protein [Desulfomonilia bacterium]HRR70529.1 hypothetical protein [Desulfomonilia bacterium]
MKKIALIVLFVLLWFSPGISEEYAIIKDSLFGTKKIEIYKNLDDALQRYTGEGKVYRITRKEIPVKKIEAKKKIEITEYEWIPDDTTEKGKK